MPKRKTLSQEQMMANKTFSVALKDVKGKRKSNKASKAKAVTTEKEEV